MNKETVRVLFAGSSLLASSPSIAGAAGTAGAATCVAHHGSNGIAIQPHLAGHGEFYPLQAPRGFRPGERRNPIIHATLVPLSGTDTGNPAACHGGLKCQHAPS